MEYSKSIYLSVPYALHISLACFCIPKRLLRKFPRKDQEPVSVDSRFRMSMANMSCEKKDVYIGELPHDVADLIDLIDLRRTNCDIVRKRYGI